jgi:hypothetical protein
MTKIQLLAIVTIFTGSIVATLTPFGTPLCTSAIIGAWVGAAILWRVK